MCEQQEEGTIFREFAFGPFAADSAGDRAIKSDRFIYFLTDRLSWLSEDLLKKLTNIISSEVGQRQQQYWQVSHRPRHREFGFPV